MKPLNPKTRAALAGAAVLAALVVVSRPAARADHPATWHDPGESDAWADADAAEQYQELDDQARQVTRRLTEKVALAEALACGEEKLDEVAARFRELNGPGRDVYRALADEYPTAGEEELAYRQVIAFVRMAARAGRSGASVVVRRLETEFAVRYPAAPRSEVR
ncbi:MAG TPA: hypothetical protein VKD90_18160 [Gemmataceae bacterium]|nr:hypothetical protein [Gemmataceae bacterium]